jgi:hypothetical protein
MRGGEIDMAAELLSPVETWERIILTSLTMRIVHRGAFAVQSDRSVGRDRNGLPGFENSGVERAEG